MKLVTDETPRTRPNTRLQEGMVVKFDGVPWRVGLVNECRARLDAITRVQRVIKHYDRKLGAETSKEIMVLPGSVNISPNSELPIIKYETRKNSIVRPVVAGTKARRNKRVRHKATAYNPSPKL